MSTADSASDIASRGYAQPEALVSTDWVAEHLDDPQVRIVESNEDPLLYPSGHIPGAAEVDWTRDLNDPVRRDYLGREGFERLMRRLGATPDTTMVFYGDKSNWWACYAFWVFQLFGHRNARVMDGGRVKWEQEGRPLTKRGAELRAQRLHGAGARRPRGPRLSRAGAGARPGEAAARRRAQPGGVQRRAHAHAQLPQRGRAARRPHPGRAEHPLGAGGQREDGTFKTADELRAALRAREGPADRATTSSPTAASASAPATPGSCSPICSAIPRCATTTAAGRSGATWWACRSRSRSRAPLVSAG